MRVRSNMISLPDYFSPLSIGEFSAIKQKTGVERLYISVITGRSGSTYIGNICYRVGFGRGQEIFNERQISALEKMAPEKNFLDFVTILFSENVINGNLYFQITPPRLTLLRKLIPDNELAEQTDVVTLITRRNILSQAISFHNAKRTGLWHSNQAGKLGTGGDFDAQKVLAWIIHISQLERGLLNFALDNKPWNFCYEDIFSSPYETISQFFAAHEYHIQPALLNKTLFDTGITKKIPNVDFNNQFDIMLQNYPWLNRILLERMGNLYSPQNTIDEIKEKFPDVTKVML